MKKILIADDHKIYDLVKFQVEGADIETLALSYSPLDKTWNHPGQTCVKLDDDGNGIKMMIDRKAFRLEYHRALELFIALQEYYKGKPEDNVEYRIYKEEEEREK